MQEILKLKINASLIYSLQKKIGIKIMKVYLIMFYNHFLQIIKAKKS